MSKIKDYFMEETQNNLEFAEKEFLAESEEMPATEYYDGFILPADDVVDLALNNFIYDADMERYEGYMEDAEGVMRKWYYHIANDMRNNFWELAITEEDEYPRE